MLECSIYWAASSLRFEGLAENLNVPGLLLGALAATSPPWSTLGLSQRRIVPCIKIDLGILRAPRHRC